MDRTHKRRTLRGVHEPLAATLERLHGQFHRREFVHPDPLEFLYAYPSLGDREIVALVAACLAYGQVVQINRSVAAALTPMAGRGPAAWLARASRAELQDAYAGFRHRVTSGADLADLLWGARRMIECRGGLGEGLQAYLRAEDATVLPALAGWVGELARAAGRRPRHLVADPAGGSACKRLHLLLRWMVRRDDVDPGGWEAVGSHRLIVPLDTHMFAVGRALGFTRRGQASAAAAEEVTAGFRRLAPADPVRYDFALTRLGIRGEGALAAFLRRCPAAGAEAAAMGPP